MAGALSRTTEAHEGQRPSSQDCRHHYHRLIEPTRQFEIFLLSEGEVHRVISPSAFWISTFPLGDTWMTSFASRMVRHAPRVQGAKSLIETGLVTICRLVFTDRNLNW